jgi:signal transduction histidine kinase
MKIKNRFYINAGILIVPAIILSSVILVMSDRIEEKNKDQEIANEIHLAISQLDMITYEYLLHHEKRMREQWISKYNSINEILEKEIEVKKLIRPGFVALSDSFSQVTANYKEKQKLIQEGAAQAKIDAVLSLEKRLVAQLLIKSSSIISDATRFAEEAHTEATKAQKLTNTLTSILVIILVVSVITTSLIFAKSILKPLGELTKGAGIIGKGGLEHKVEVKTKDEIGELANAFNRMTSILTSNLKTITASHDELNKEITERKQAEEELRKLKEELEVKVTERTKELQESVQKLNKSQKAMLLMVEDLNQTSKELKKANIKLKGLDHLKSMFIASMSHELRTPLNSIIGLTGIILQGISGKITEVQRKELMMVKNSANHLLVLINDIIDVSKIEAGKVELVIEELDLSELIQEVSNSFKIAVDKKGLKLSLETPERLIIKSDKRRAKQVIINLMSNAVKYMDKGEIEIKAAKKDECVEVSVADTGIGIKKENIKMLFKQFSRIHVAGMTRVEGTGLGLYISKKIADLLGGEIEAKSEFGKGSKFTFTLPLKHKGVKT